MSFFWWGITRGGIGCETAKSTSSGESASSKDEIDEKKAKYIGFIRGRDSNSAIRMKEGREFGVTQVVRDIFG